MKVSCIAGQEGLLSISNEGSRGLQKFLLEKFNALNGQGLERILEVDPCGVLELLNESGVEHSDKRVEIVCNEKAMPLGGVDRNLRSELSQESSDGANKGRLQVADVNESKGPPSKSVAFRVSNERGGLSPASSRSTGVPNVGQLLPSGSRRNGTVYGTSELKSIAWRRADKLSETKFYGNGQMGFLSLAEVATQQEMNTRCSKLCSIDSARTLLKECFADNPPVRLDPYQHFTGMSWDQIIQFARAIGLEVPLTTF